jgi:hypothetical protein
MRDVVRPVDGATMEPMAMPWEVRWCQSPRLLFHERPPERAAATLLDGSGYMAGLFTGPDFGCTLHEAVLDEAVLDEARLVDLRAECVRLVEAGKVLTEEFNALRGPINVAPLQERLRKVAAMLGIPEEPTAPVRAAHVDVLVVDTLTPDEMALLGKLNAVERLNAAEAQRLRMFRRGESPCLCACNGPSFAGTCGCVCHAAEVGHG